MHVARGDLLLYLVCMVAWVNWTSLFLGFFLLIFFIISPAIIIKLLLGPRVDLDEIDLFVIWR